MTFFAFPPPKDPEEFERIVEQIAGPVLRSQEVNLNGRRGQAQDGVDVSVTTDAGEVGIQCKVTAKLKIGTVREEVRKAKGYVPKLTHFIVATTSPSDAVLQAEVRKVQAPFKLSLWSWDEINNHLNRLPGVAMDYVQHVLMGSKEASERQHAIHLREALDRPALLYGAHAERDFVAQIEALKDTSAFLRTGLLYTRGGLLVSGLPYRRYSDSYADALAKVVDRVGKLDSYTGRYLPVLTDPTHPDHQRTLNEAERRRIAVLDVANAILDEWDLSLLPLRP
jgi:Restriction endonuclease